MTIKPSSKPPPSVNKMTDGQKAARADRQTTNPSSTKDGNSIKSGDEAGGSAAALMLKLEHELRQLRSPAEFGFFVANETRLVTRSQQTFLFMTNGRAVPKVTAVSAMSVVDRSAPLVIWIEALVRGTAASHGLLSPLEFGAESVTLADGVAYAGYPLRFMVWVPLLSLENKLIGGLLQARASPWTSADLIVSQHLAGACSHAWLAITNQSYGLRYKPQITRAAVITAITCSLVLGFVPVSMSALAPVEVSTSRAFVVTAPIEGVVDGLLVEPNAAVKKDQPLIRMADTVLRNRLEVADREMLVADAKVKKAGQLAFSDMRGRHDLGVAQAELQLRRSERDYARDLLERSIIKAERDGIAFFADARDLIGRPVVIGERLMELADPMHLEFRIDLPVADAIVLHDGARVKVFLDSDPLRPIEARLVRTEFQARLRDNQQLSFRLIAEKARADDRPLRLGVRGTAQVYSDKVSLAFYLFRRPLSAARQWLGL